MAMIEINWNPSRRELRQFAGVWWPAFFAMAAFFVWRRTHNMTPVLVLLLPALAVSIAGVLRPQWMRPIFVGWMCAAFPIGWLVSHVLLAATYYLVLTPIGILMRLLGHDPLQRRWDHAAASYWQPRDERVERGRYFRQF